MVGALGPVARSLSRLQELKVAQPKKAPKLHVWPPLEAFGVAAVTAVEVSGPEGVELGLQAAQAFPVIGSLEEESCCQMLLDESQC